MSFVLCYAMICDEFKIKNKLLHNNYRKSNGSRRTFPKT